MKYPADIVTDRWGRIHRGHGLDVEMLREDLEHNVGPQPVGHDLHIDQWHLGYAPRVKWCENYGWPCDEEGEWHAHWYAAKPTDDNAFTMVSWQRVYADQLTAPGEVSDAS